MAEENKEIIDKKENKTKTKLSTTQKIMIAGFALILIAIAIVGYFIYQSLQPEPADVAGSSYVIDESNLEDVVSTIEARVKDSMFEFNMNTTWRFPDGKSASSNALVGNSANNTYPIAIDLYLEGEETPIYTSTIIPVGSQIGQLILERELKAGNYAAVCQYNILDDQGNVKYSSGVNVNLIIEN